MIEALGANDWSTSDRQRAHQRARHPLVLPRRRRRRRGARPGARHRAGAQGRLALRRRVRGDAAGPDRASATGWEPGRIGIHILIETAAGHGQRRGDQPGAARPARGDGVRRRRLRGQRPARARRTSAAPTRATRCSPTPCRRRGRARSTGAISGTSGSAGWWRRAALKACVRSTARSATSTTPTATAVPRGAPRRWAARASGRSTRRRSSWRTRSSRPSEDEVDRARRILQAMEDAAKEGKGAVSLDGRLIDAASIRMAREPDPLRSRQIDEARTHGDVRSPRRARGGDDGHPRVPGQAAAAQLPA